MYTIRNDWANSIGNCDACNQFTVEVIKSHATFLSIFNNFRVL